MTLRKISILSAAVIIAVTGMVQAAVTPPMHITIEYEYARDGEIVSRTVNGKVQRYAYDRRGQLTGIYGADGQAVEAYTYDAAGNILKKTINGKTTTFTYDAANQLVSKQDDGGTTSYEYDAAGRMIREGDKEYRYSYLDKITSVIENGETAATMDYFVGGQLASVTRGHEIERFIWDGLALVHRDGSDYLNEPAIGGGNPIASGGQVMFNDMLGSTVAVKGDENYSLTSMTAFGESSDTGAFFTGKPFVGEIGYAFLMRSYRPEHGKWQTADPIGYPDGWNNLAYCNNGVTYCIDKFGTDIHHLVDNEGGWGFGHSMWVVGNETDGYTLYDYQSDGLSGSGSSGSFSKGESRIIPNIATIEEAIAKANEGRGEQGRVDKGQWWETSSEEDAAAMDAAGNYMSESYTISGHNCYHLGPKALIAAVNNLRDESMQLGVMDIIWPNTAFYENLTLENGAKRYVME